MRSNRKRFFLCFQSVFHILFATGCLSFRLNSQQNLEISIWTRVYTNLGRFVGLGSFFVGWICKIYSHHYSESILALSPLLQLLGLVELGVSLLTYINVSISMEFQKQMHADLFNKAYELDKIFIEELEVSFNYDKDIRKTTINSRLLMLYCGIYYIASFISLDPDWRVALMAFGYAICTLGPLASSYAHVSLIYFLRIRFELFQNIFQKLFSLDLKQEDAKRRRINQLINHYRKYCDLIPVVNIIYGHTTMVNYLHDFTQTSCLVFVLCHKALESKASAIEYLLLFMFVLPRMLKVVYMAAHSRATILALKSCRRVIATYDDHYPLNEAKEQIDELLLWNKLNQFQFNVGSVLQLNFGLVYAFFFGIGNYVLILIQLKFQETSIKDRVRGATKIE